MQLGGAPRASQAPSRKEAARRQGPGRGPMGSSRPRFPNGEPATIPIQDDAVLEFARRSVRMTPDAAKHATSEKILAQG